MNAIEHHLNGVLTNLICSYLMIEQSWVETWLDASVVHDDLNQLLSILEQQHSYFLRNQNSFLRALAALRVRLENGCTRGELTTEVSLLLHTLADGHCRIHPDQFARSQLGSKLPFVMQLVGQRFVAMSDEQTLLRSGFPFLKSLDGILLETWLEAAKMMATAGGLQAQHLRSGKALVWLGFFRQKLGLADTKTLLVELEAESGETITIEIPVVDTVLEFPKPDKPVQQILESNIGYLCLQQMQDSSEFLDSLIPAMQALRDTQGLIIDVRGNGGGTRHALRVLFPFFLAPDDAPHVYTVAALRIPEGEARDDPEGYLADRFLYPLTSSIWSESEQVFMKAFAAQFTPTWQLPFEKSSALHFGILPRSEYHYYYDKPVVLLINERCASATDVFVSAFKGWRNTTVIGSNTMGTSGRPDGFKLNHSGIKFMASSIVSYRSDGQLYEGLGTFPDSPMSLSLSDVTEGTDSILEAAIQRFTA